MFLVANPFKLHEILCLSFPPPPLPPVHSATVAIPYNLRNNLYKYPLAKETNGYLYRLSVKNFMQFTLFVTRVDFANTGGL